MATFTGVGPISGGVGVFPGASQPRDPPFAAVTVPTLPPPGFNGVTQWTFKPITPLPGSTGAGSWAI